MKLLFSLTTLAVFLFATAADSSPAVAQAPDGVIPDQYIVVLQDGVANPQAVANEHSRQHGASLSQIYDVAIKGYAARIPAARLAAVRNDPRVAFVEADRAWELADQEVPTGINRIEVDKNPTADVDQGQEDPSGEGPEPQFSPLAVIDTGVSLHPDLYVAGRVDCTKKNCPSGGDDNNGHGTHVAGTAAARDNGSGVVGVAPGAPIYSVKVCNSVCLTSHMLAGINWVASRKSSGAINFAAANMSISTGNNDAACAVLSTDSIRNAICGVVAKGVVFALAAGNNAALKKCYDAAFCVSAMEDSDGKAGGLGGAEDDTLASFSNYGSTIDIAAPGVGIRSTWKGGGYNTISGTSMATPHVTGAVSLYLAATGLPAAADADGVDTIEAAIAGAGALQGTDCGYVNERAAQGGSDEPLLFVNSIIPFGGDGSCD